MPTKNDRFDMLSETALALIMRPGGLEKAIAGSVRPEVHAYILQLAAIYKEYFDPTFDETCPYCIDTMVKYFKRRREDKVVRDRELARTAAMIPSHERKEILDTYLIEAARPVATDSAMYYLADVWRRNIDPNFTGDCDACFSKILKDLKAMLPELKQLQANENLLKDL